MILEHGKIKLMFGDCIDIVSRMPDNCIDSIVCDPPYHLTSVVKRFGKDNSAPAQYGTDGAFKRASAGFMGQEWDGGDITFDPTTWSHMLRVLKPGGHLLAFSGSRTYHRMAVAVEDAGFEIRDQVLWLYGSGFPKSHKQADGWGTALKPAHEPVVMARKPFKGSVAANMAKWGTGGINIEGCKVGDERVGKWQNTPGRFPANVMHDGINELWSHYFYCAKASKADRGEGNNHPTVKPNKLMRYLCRLVTPVGGVILDPFMGSGSTGKAAIQEGFAFMGIDMTAEYFGIAAQRLFTIDGPV